jgi:hypothetical protein
MLGSAAFVTALVAGAMVDQETPLGVGFWDRFKGGIAREDLGIIDMNKLYGQKEMWDEEGNPRVMFAPVRAKYAYFSAAYRVFADGPARLIHRYAQFSSLPHVGYKTTDDDVRTPVPSVPWRFLNPLTRRTKDLYVAFDPAWKGAVMNDPYLLRKLDNSRFQVLAHWDLSENEKRLIR